MLGTVVRIVETSGGLEDIETHDIEVSKIVTNELQNGLGVISAATTANEVTERGFILIARITTIVFAPAIGK